MRGEAARLAGEVVEGGREAVGGGSEKKFAAVCQIFLRLALALRSLSMFWVKSVKLRVGHSSSTAQLIFPYKGLKTLSALLASALW